MKSWPKNFTLKLLKSYMMNFFLLIGIMTVLKTFIFNEDQIKAEVINNCWVAFLISFALIYLDRNEWKERLKQEREALKKIPINLTTEN